MNYKSLFIAPIIIGALVFTSYALYRDWTPNVPTTKEVVTPILSTEKVTEIATTASNEPKLRKSTVTNLEAKPEQIVLFNTEFDFNTVELAIQRIAEVSKDHDDIYLVLDSPGGSVFDGSRLISYIEASDANVHTVVRGVCASMCFQTFEHGKTRYIVDRSVIMAHQAAGQVMGQVKNMKSLLGFIDKEVQKLDAYAAHRAGMTAKEFDSLVTSDLWLAADDAISLKLADKLATIDIYSGAEKVFNMKNEMLKRNLTLKALTTVNPLVDIK